MEWLLHDFFSSSVGFQITAPMWTWMISTHPPPMDLWTLSSPVKLPLRCDLLHQVVLRIKLEKYVMRVCPPPWHAHCRQSPITVLTLVIPSPTSRDAHRHGNQGALAVLLEARPRVAKGLANGHIPPIPSAAPLWSGLLRWYHSCCFAKAVWEETETALCDPNLCSTWNSS